jgi:hypothetical protein
MLTVLLQFYRSQQRFFSTFISLIFSTFDQLIYIFKSLVEKTAPYIVFLNLIIEKARFTKCSKIFSIQTARKTDRKGEPEFLALLTEELVKLKLLFHKIVSKKWK